MFLDDPVFRALESFVELDSYLYPVFEALGLLVELDAYLFDSSRRGLLFVVIRGGTVGPIRSFSIRGGKRGGVGLVVIRGGRVGPIRSLSIRGGKRGGVISFVFLGGRAGPVEYFSFDENIIIKTKLLHFTRIWSN